MGSPRRLEKLPPKASKKDAPKLAHVKKEGANAEGDFKQMNVKREVVKKERSEEELTKEEPHAPEATSPKEEETIKRERAVQRTYQFRKKMASQKVVKQNMPSSSNKRTIPRRQ